MVAKSLEAAKEMTSHISDLITKREEQKKARRRSKAPSELSEEEARIKLYLGIGTQALHVGEKVGQNRFEFRKFSILKHLNLEYKTA